MKNLQRIITWLCSSNHCVSWPGTLWCRDSLSESASSWHASDSFPQRKGSDKPEHSIRHSLIWSQTLGGKKQSKIFWLLSSSRLHHQRSFHDPTDVYCLPDSKPIFKSNISKDYFRTLHFFPATALDIASRGRARCSRWILLPQRNILSFQAGSQWDNENDFEDASRWWITGKHKASTGKAVGPNHRVSHGVLRSQLQLPGTRQQTKLETGAGAHIEEWKSQKWPSGVQNRADNDTTWQLVILSISIPTVQVLQWYN